MVIYVELVRFGRVVARHKVDRLPATLGRAYDNDVILDERHVSAHHAVLEAGPDGAPFLRDLGSSNGTLVLGRGVERTPMPEEAVLGGAVVRFRDASAPVPKTVVLAASADPPVPLYRVLLALLLMVLGVYLRAEMSHSGPLDVPDMASDAVLGAVLLCLWAIAWAGVSWGLRRSFAFRAHLTIATLGVVGSMALQPLRRLVIFSLDAERAWPWVNAAVLGALSVAWIYLHLSRAGAWRAKLRWVSAASAACAIVLLWALSNFGGASAFSPLPKFSGDMLPPALRLASPRGPEPFFEQARGLKGEVDALAADR